MAKERPYVPALPALGWAQLRAATRPLGEHPFAASSVSWTYRGRSALYLAARVLGLEGREVLVPAYHQGVEVDALLAAGAQPAFYRVGPRWGVDPEDLETRIGPRTGAILLTHFGGFPGPLGQLRALADRRGLVLIEDCAQALLSSDGEVPLGSTGDAAIFSLGRTLAVPHGGAVVFNGRRLFQLPRLQGPARGRTIGGALRRWSLLAELQAPRRRGRLWRLVRWMSHQPADAARAPEAGAPLDRTELEMGMSPLVARIARAHDLAAVVERRRRNFFHLLGALRGGAPPLVHELPPGVCPSFYPLWVEDRDEVLARLRSENVEAGEGWPTFHPRCDRGEFPEAERLRRHLVELPCHQDLGPPQVAHLARIALRAVSRDRTRSSRAAQG